MFDDERAKMPPFSADGKIARCGPAVNRARKPRRAVTFHETLPGTRKGPPGHGECVKFIFSASV